MADDLDGLVRRIDPNRWLASRFIQDRMKRADVIALYAYDHELARAPKVASTPLIAEIRLTWWREVLDEIYAGRNVRAHPTASALNAAVHRHSLPREPLEAMIDARIEALDNPAMSLDEARSWAADVGASATFLASIVLDPTTFEAVTRQAGEAWGLLMLRRSGTVPVGLDDRVRHLIVAVKSAQRKVSAVAFPAIAAVTLARTELAGGRASALGVRLRLLAAVMKGSI